MKRLYFGDKGYYGFALKTRFLGFVKIDGKRYWLFRQEH